MLGAMRRLSIDEAARELGLSVSSVRRRIRTGALKTEQATTAQGFRYVVVLEDTPEHAATEVPADVGDTLAAVVAERDWLRARVEELTALLNREQETALRLAAAQVDSQRLLSAYATPSQIDHVPAPATEEPATHAERPENGPARVESMQKTTPAAPEAVEAAARAAGLKKKDRRRLLKRLADALRGG
jgi:hypothetical protein